MQVKQRKQTNQVVLSRLLLTEFDYEERTHFFYSVTIQRETKKYFFIENFNWAKLISNLAILPEVLGK